MGGADDFITRWRSTLETGALVHFAHGPCEVPGGNHCQIADTFVSALGLKPIGFNWELLDAGAPQDDVRSGVGEVRQALSFRLENPSLPWLPEAHAGECAQEFVGLFDPAHLTLVSNRYDGLWNPIAGGATEWGFVGFDADLIALLLLVER